MKVILTAGNKPIYLRRVDGAEVLEFTSGATIDADGSPRAYHPTPGKGLDYIGNAGRPGNWWGIATDKRGRPYIQGPTDPAPGFYVSTTAYERTGFKSSDPARYLDSEKVPFVVVPLPLRSKVKGIVLGCYAEVRNRENGRKVIAVVGDLGPTNHLGEISIAAAKALGIKSDAKRGGATSGVEYRVYPGREVTVDGEKFRLISA